jgi:hypothetical protein
MIDGKLPCTRDSLEQMIEGACSDCNQIGKLGANRFIRHLTELCAFWITNAAANTSLERMLSISISHTTGWTFKKVSFSWDYRIGWGLRTTGV